MTNFLNGPTIYAGLFLKFGCFKVREMQGRFLGYFSKDRVKLLCSYVCYELVHLRILKHWNRTCA